MTSPALASRTASSIRWRVPASGTGLPRASHAVRLPRTPKSTGSPPWSGRQHDIRTSPQVPQCDELPVMSTDARTLHHDAVVADTHNDLILLVDHFDKREQRTHFADFWLPELRAGGVDVQVLPICLEEEFQSEGGLRRTLLLVERIHELVAEHPAEVALCLTGDDVDAATAAGKIALIIALEGAHGIGQDPKLIRTMFR